MNDIELRIKKLLEEMTVREKIGQTIMIEPAFCLDHLLRKGESYTGLEDPKYLHKLINEYNVGFFLYGGATRIGNDELIDWAKHIKAVNQFSKDNHRIPLLFGVDAIHGVNFVKQTTIFSHNLGVVSTWNEELTKKYADVVSKELDSIGMNCNFAPTIDVARDQRWGRVYESLGEDSYLASKMSSALVEGMQESNVAACAKHYLGYGESYNGRDRNPSSLSERSIIETHLPPFEAAVTSGVKTIMVNGGDLNGTPMPANRKMMTDVLRKQLNFTGITMSDWEDVGRLATHHHIAKDKKDAIMKSFNAGLDMSMIVSDLEVVDIMEELINENKISYERLDEAVSNILRVKLEMELFDYPLVNIEDVEKRFFKEEAKEIARRITLESITLLKNDDNLLPLKRDLKKVIVLGKTANSKRHMCGGWTLNWASANEEDLDFDTVLEGLKKYLPNVDFIHVDTVDKLKGTDLKDIDLCISVVGEEPHSEWLGDTDTMAIDHEDYQLLQQASIKGLKTVMVAMLGRPMDLRWVVDNVDALLYTYYPGSEGALPICEILFGDETPSGKTPITFPKESNQIPMYYDAKRYSGGHYDPLYPFGFGLSYTSFEYSDITIPESCSESLDITLTIKNIGNYKGAEVVQVYLRNKYASVTTSIKSLKGFKKVFLNPNEEKEITITLTKDDLSIIDQDLKRILEEREIEIIIGDFKKTVTIKK